MTSFQSPKKESSVIAEAAHDPVSGVLTVRMHNGKEYSLQNVPADLHAGLLDAESPGQFYNANIRGKFDRVGDDA